MKIITWNVNGIRAVAKKGFLPFITREAPDVLCLQETKAHAAQVEPEVRMPNGYVGTWAESVRKGYSGVATFIAPALAKRAPNLMPTAVRASIGIPEYDQEGRVVVSDHGDFLLYNIYFPNGGSGDERHQFKQKFLADLNEVLRADLSRGREVIVVGDYNVAHREIDVYDPVRLAAESGFLPEERAWFDRFLDLGFVDCFRHFYPNEKGAFTWWSYVERARMVNRGWRIDYVCVSKGLLPRLKSCRILDDVEGSDHCPVAIELSI